MSSELSNDGAMPNLVAVYTTYVYEEAYIIAGRLESESIPSMVQRESVAGALGISIGRMGEVNVFVREQDYIRARDLLAEDHTLELPESTDDIIFHMDDDDNDESDDYGD